MSISLDNIVLSDRAEAQIDWVDRRTWQPIGQNIRYALQGNPVITENPRSGRPITLVAEVPWAWLTSATVEALVVLASEVNYSFTFVWGAESYTVRFRRDAGPLELSPIDPRREYYTGSIYLIQV
jgi:hypothetical protein